MKKLGWIFSAYYMKTHIINGHEIIRGKKKIVCVLKKKKKEDVLYSHAVLSLGCNQSQSHSPMSIFSV